MLCPNCGADVGNTPKLCERCAAPATVPQNEVIERQPTEPLVIRSLVDRSDDERPEANREPMYVGAAAAAVVVAGMSAAALGVTSPVPSIAAAIILACLVVLIWWTRLPILALPGVIAVALIIKPPPAAAPVPLTPAQALKEATRGELGSNLPADLFRMVGKVAGARSGGAPTDLLGRAIPFEVIEQQRKLGDAVRREFESVAKALGDAEASHGGARSAYDPRSGSDVEAQVREFQRVMEKHYGAEMQAVQKAQAAGLQLMARFAQGTPDLNDPEKVLSLLKESGLPEEEIARLREVLQLTQKSGMDPAKLQKALAELMQPPPPPAFRSMGELR